MAGKKDKAEHDQYEQDLHTAYHEAGHAVVGYILGRTILSVTIVPDGRGAVGKVDFGDRVPPHFGSFHNQSPEKRQYVKDRIVGELAGGIAQSIRFPDRARDAADEADARWARDLATELELTERAAASEEGMRRASTLLSANWEFVEAVANALSRHRTLTGDEFLALEPAAKRSGG